MDGRWRGRHKAQSSDELEGTLGKGTESLLLGDGEALPRFSGIARQAGTVQTTGFETRKPSVALNLREV